MKTDESPLPVFLTSKQAAGVMAISANYLRWLLKEKKGPPVHRIGKRYRFRKADLLDWIDSKRR